MPKVAQLYQVTIGFNSEYGYAAAVMDLRDKRVKGIKGNSIRQLCRNLHELICEDDQKKRNFPLEREAPVIITPESNDPLFNGV